MSLLLARNKRTLLKRTGYSLAIRFDDDPETHLSSGNLYPQWVYNELLTQQFGYFNQQLWELILSNTPN